jgi:hypothetical protein
MQRTKPSEALCWFLLGLLVASFFWVEVSIYKNIRHPTPNHASETSENCRAASCVKKSSDDRIADYTWWVAFFTFALSAVSAIQIGFLLRADKTARISADAAQSTAQALRDNAANELRAYVSLEDIYFLYRGEERTDGERREFTNIHRIRVRNYGRTPARNMEIWIERAFTAPTDHDFIVLNRRQSNFPAQDLGPSHRFGTRLEQRVEFPYTARFFTYGRIQYQGIYGTWWVHEFCYEHIPPRRFAPHGSHNREREGGKGIRPSL